MQKKEDSKRLFWLVHSQMQKYEPFTLSVFLIVDSDQKRVYEAGMMWDWPYTSKEQTKNSDIKNKIYGTITE